MQKKIDKERQSTHGLTIWSAPIKVLDGQKQTLILDRRKRTLLDRL